MAYEIPVGGPSLDTGQQALLDLLRLLEAQGYAFTPVTSSTQGRVVRRREGDVARGLRDFLGWSLPALPGSLDGNVLRLLDAAGAISTDAGHIRSSLRVSTVAGRLFLHSAWPTRAPDSVFLGPDSCRFVRFLQAALAGGSAPRRIVDIGAGSGVGGVSAALLNRGARLQLTDINPAALRLAAVNAAAAGVASDLVTCSGLGGVESGFDLALANPPFMAGSGGRLYSAGGGTLGEKLSLDWAAAALEKLAPAGRLLLYTGSAIRDGGEDVLRARLHALAGDAGADIDYAEVDPDIFGDVLSMERYAGVERIAAVSALLTKPE